MSAPTTILNRESSAVVIQRRYDVVSIQGDIKDANIWQSIDHQRHSQKPERSLAAGFPPLRDGLCILLEPG